MWNLCSASKLISQRQKQRNYELHQQKLAKMKPKMKVVQPFQPEFIYEKRKLQMSRTDRKIEIDRQNEILLIKMKQVNQAQYLTNKLRPESQQLKTLNQHIMQQQTQQICHENRRICQKLLKIDSFYPTLDIMNQTEQLQKIRFNISENSKRSQSTANLRPRSSLTYHSQRFHKSKQNQFDPQGLPSNENTMKNYKIASEANLRPESAPVQARYRRPVSSQHSKAKPKIKKLLPHQVLLEKAENRDKN